MGPFDAILNLGRFLIIIIVSLFSGIDLPISSFKGQIVEIYPVAKIINYNVGGLWENGVNYLDLDKDDSSSGITIKKITKLTRFKVTRVRLSQSGFSMRLSKMCYFTNVENSKEYFVGNCENIEGLNQTTKYLIKMKHFFDKNKRALVVARNSPRANLKKVFEVNRAAIFEITSFDEFLKFQTEQSYSYEKILYERLYLMPYSYELKESDFYKYDYGNKVNSWDEHEKINSFEKNIIPDDLLVWISKTYPDNINNRWVLKFLYILSRTDFVPGNYRDCFENNNKIKDVTALIDRFNNEMNVNIKVRNTDSMYCNFKKPTILDNRFFIK